MLIKPFLILSVFLIIWTITCNIIGLYLSENYYKIIHISVDPQDFITNTTDHKQHLKYIGLLENDYMCEFNVVNSIMMNEIIEEMEFSNIDYYTKVNFGSDMCDVPITFVGAIVGKIVLAISIIVLSFTITVGFMSCGFRFYDNIAQCFDECGHGSNCDCGYDCDCDCDWDLDCERGTSSQPIIVTEFDLLN